MAVQREKEIDHDRLVALAQLLSVIVVGVVAGIFVGTQVGQVRVQSSFGARDFTW